MAQNTIKIVEVGPRDGLQNEAKPIPLAIKLEFIRDLVASGLTTIEATAFVSAKRVAQMADHREVLSALDVNSPIHYPVLIPNVRGLKNALSVGVKDIAVFCAASETFSQHNTQCSISESLVRIADVLALAKQHHLNVRGYISCVMGCPYHETIQASTVAQLSEQLLQMGCEEIALGDTVGTGTLELTDQLIDRVSQHVPINKLAVHFHDTYQRAIGNIALALDKGISIIDSSATGLGGCPYAPGARGNVATENVLDLLRTKGIPCTIDKTQIIQAGQKIRAYLNQTH